MMRYSYFPGCSMEATGIEFHKSMTYVNNKIGVQFEEIPDWNCCGATAGHAVSKELGMALPARNVALCEQQGLGLPIAVSCASCYSRMKYAVHKARSEENEKLSRIIDMPIKGDLDVISLLEVYNTPEARDAISKAIVRPFTNLKAACYYGCLFTRPAELTGVSDVENPTIMDEILALTGAEPVEWSFKTECCGASQHLGLPRECKPLLYRILNNARANDAEAIVTACPLCMMNLDMRQRAINKAYNEQFDIPVYYITEILAVAMGANLKESGVNTHFHPAGVLLETSGRGAL